jgi:hypothetical protein
MTDTPSKKPAYVVMGATGLKQTGGYIQEEYLQELSGDRWWRAIQEMSTQDPTIVGILFAIQMLMRQTPWTVTPYSDEDADKETAAFVEECMHDMRDPWPLILAEILSFLPWGYAPMEVVYKVRGGEITRPDGTIDAMRSSKFDDGKVGWGCWSIRSQDTITRWEFDEESGEATAFFQVAPPFYREVRIPLAKCLHFRASSRKANPEGVSLLRGVYRPWYFKKRIENIEGVGVERDLAGFPMGYVPSEILAGQTTEARAALAEYQKQITNVRRDEQEGMLWPSDRDDKGNRLFEFSLLTSGGARQFDTGKIVERYDTRIAMSVLADFILIGHQGVGSRSLVSSKTSLFSSALGSWLDMIDGTVNARIPELLRFNGMDAERPPRLQHGDVEKIDLADLGEYLKSYTAAKAGGMFDGPAGPRLQNYVLEQAGLPTPTDKEQEQAAQEEEQRKAEEAKQKADQLAALQQQQAGTPPPPPRTPPEEPPPPAGEPPAAARAAERDAVDTLIDDVLDEAFAAAEAAGEEQG